MSGTHRPESRRERRRHGRFHIWNCIVMAIGYIAIIYELARLVVYLYLQLTGAGWTIK